MKCVTTTSHLIHSKVISLRKKEKKIEPDLAQTFKTDYINDCTRQIKFISISMLTLMQEISEAIKNK